MGLVSDAIVRRAGRGVKGRARGCSPRGRNRLGWGPAPAAGPALLSSRPQAPQAPVLQETGTPPSRWRRELSGAYLIWWLCAAFCLAWLIFRWPLSDPLLESTGVVTAIGLLLRLILLALFRGPRRRHVDRLGTMRFSWWWGRGLLPALLALLPGAAYWGAARVIGWR